MSKVAVVLAGCGAFDGAEIHEATLTLLYLDQAKSEVTCFAPDKPQMHVINHSIGEPVEGESRNVITEAARICRGNIKPLSDLQVADFDAIIFPGGFGAAKNLCTFAVDGTNCTIDPDVERVTREAVEKGKVIGTICISPVITARALRDTDVKPRLTIGTDQGTMDALKTMNAEPVEASATEIVVDEKNRIVSTPAYMLGQSISEVGIGIEKLVKQVVKMTNM